MSRRLPTLALGPRLLDSSFLLHQKLPKVFTGVQAVSKPAHGCNDQSRPGESQHNLLCFQCHVVDFESLSFRFHSHKCPILGVSGGQ